MKKLISLITAAALIALTAITLSGCDTPKVRVESTLDISSAFSGSRAVTIKYPLSVDIDSIKDTVISDSPASEVSGAAFEYKGVEEDGYYFELVFTFGNREEYEEEVTAVIGRPASSLLSTKNTVLTKGTRMAENFDTSDLIKWMTRITAAEPSTKDLTFDYSVNNVVIGSQKFSTGSTVNVNEVEGSTVNHISIRTSNDKAGHYDRTVVFSIPDKEYISSKDEFESYFLTNTAPAAKYYGWSAEGANMLYTVIYEGLNISELAEYTSMLLDTDSVEISYEDRDNSSTPLSEGLAFEESLDTFSFIGPEKGSPTLIYTYNLPTNTIHGDGAVFTDGRWNGAGKWEEGVYKLELSEGAVQLRIPDGIQYSINGVDFLLESLGGERFKRTTSFLYSKTDGYDGMTYAESFFKKKGVVTTTSEDEDNLICSVVTEGTANEITAELVKLFGSGNFMAYRKTTGPFALSTKTNLTDYISLGSILNSSNANRPMRYYVSSSGEENIVTLSIDGTEIAYNGKDKTPLSITGGNATVEYRGNIPIMSHIVIYIVGGCLLLLITILIAYLMLRRSRPKKLGDEAQKIVDEVVPEKDESVSAADSLSQTTTFSIFELGALSRNKRYVDEINKDIEQRLEADRLEERKKEIRAKELEEMERKVYGSEETPSEDSYEDNETSGYAVDESGFVKIPDLPEEREEADFPKFPDPPGSNELSEETDDNADAETESGEEDV